MFNLEKIDVSYSILNFSQQEITTTAFYDFNHGNGSRLKRLKKNSVQYNEISQID